MKVSSKQEFASLLLPLVPLEQAKTIGDAGGFGGTAWITARLGDHESCSTPTRSAAAVAAYLDHVRQSGPDLPWRVVANIRGIVNKVVFSDDPAHAAGWYLYLRNPLAQPGQL